MGPLVLWCPGLQCRLAPCSLALPLEPGLLSSCPFLSSVCNHTHTLLWNQPGHSAVFFLFSSFFWFFESAVFFQGPEPDSSKQNL